MSLGVMIDCSRDAVMTVDKLKDFITILATLSYLPVYLLSISAEIMLKFKKEKNITISGFIKKSIIPLIAFIYVIWTIYGSGAETVMWGFILMLIGIPIYVYNHHKNRVDNIV